MFREEVVRFCAVGVIAAAIQYGMYYLMLLFTSHNVAYSIGYLVSFAANYLLTTSFTFKTRKKVGNGIGFAVCHVINYSLQVGLLNLFIWLGLSKIVAPIPVFAICVPTNFLLVRWVMTRF